MEKCWKLEVSLISKYCDSVDFIILDQEKTNIQQSLVVALGHSLVVLKISFF